MSHFTVAVIVDKLEDLEKALEPFNENKEVEPYICKTKKQIIDDAKNQLERLKQDKKRYLENKSSFAEKYNQQYIKMIENFNEKEVKNDDELYLGEVNKNNGEYEIDKEGNFLTTYNPLAKWDWWSIGGRWQHLLILKNDASKEDYSNISEAEILGFQMIYKTNEPDKITANTAKIKAIDFKEMQRANREFRTFAMIFDGEWYECGEMLYFGISKSTDESIKKFEDIFDSVIAAEENQDKWLVVIDCHI